MSKIALFYYQFYLRRKDYNRQDKIQVTDLFIINQLEQPRNGNVSSRSFAKAQVLGDGMQTFVGGGSVGGVALVCVSTVLQQLTADLTDDADAVLLVLHQHDRHAAVKSHSLLTASCTKYNKYRIILPCLLFWKIFLLIGQNLLAIHQMKNNVRSSHIAKY